MTPGNSASEQPGAVEEMNEPIARGYRGVETLFPRQPLLRILDIKTLAVTKRVGIAVALEPHDGKAKEDDRAQQERNGGNYKEAHEKTL